MILVIVTVQIYITYKKTQGIKCNLCFWGSSLTCILNELNLFQDASIDKYSLFLNTDLVQLNINSDYIT